MSSRHWCVTLAEGYWKRFVDTETSVIACLQAERVSNLRPNERTKGCDDVNFIRPIAKGFDWREYDGFRCPVPPSGIKTAVSEPFSNSSTRSLWQTLFCLPSTKTQKNSIYSFFFSFFQSSYYSLSCFIIPCAFSYFSFFIARFIYGFNIPDNFITWIVGNT